MPGRQFIIDGQVKTIRQLVPGTMLAATVVTKILPVDYRGIVGDREAELSSLTVITGKASRTPPISSFEVFSQAACRIGNSRHGTMLHLACGAE